MTIIDPHFGGEIITKKGKLLYFDDIGCILSYLQSEQLNKNQLKDVYLVDYSQSGHFVKVEDGFLLKSASLHSPMGSNLVAFQSRDSQQYYREPLAAIEVDWSALLHIKP
jgi:copper chaperone NosL